MAMRLDDGTTRRSAGRQRSATRRATSRPRSTARPAGYGNMLAQLRAANPGVLASHVRQAADDSLGYGPSRASSGGSSGGGGGGGGGGGRRRGYRSYGGYGGYGRGGGGGGGGGGNQAQLNYLKSVLGSGAFTAKPREDLRANVRAASAADLATANQAYDSLGKQIGVGADPYRGMRTAGVRSQGGQEGQDAYGAFQNVLSILSAARGQDINSQRLAMGMGRRQATEQISGFQRAALQGISNQEAAAQRQMDQQRLQVALQLAELIGGGAKAPTLAELGLA